MQRTGEEGFSKAAELIPDLVITDLMMPGVDGLELCRRIRSSESICHIPIIIITEKSTEADRVQGLDAGADAYLYKPFNSEELIVRVAKLLDMRRALRETYSRALVEGAENSVQLADSDQKFVSKLCDIIYAQMKGGDFDIETIAEKMCMSRSQFNRKVLAITGCNAAAYIVQVRMGRARRMLDADENALIGDVAEKCGYSDVGHFSRIFKQLYNMTPTQYRRQPHSSVR